MHHGEERLEGHLSPYCFLTNLSFFELVEWHIATAVTGQVQRLLRIHFSEQLPQRIFTQGHCSARVHFRHVFVQELQRVGALVAVRALEKNTLTFLRIDSRVSD